MNAPNRPQEQKRPIHSTFSVNLSKNQYLDLNKWQKIAPKKWPQFFRTPWGLAKNNETKKDHKTEV
jgi:hypothetical protein